MVRMTFKPLFLLAVAFLGGCARQSVRPYFEAAISNFKTAQELECRIVEAETNQQLTAFTTSCDQLERAALESLRVLIVSGWDSKANDFKGDHRTVAWAGWFGVGSSEQIPERELRIEQILLAAYLNETVTIRVEAVSWYAPLGVCACVEGGRVIAGVLMPIRARGRDEPRDRSPPTQAQLVVGKRSSHISDRHRTASPHPMRIS